MPQITKSGLAVMRVLVSSHVPMDRFDLADKAGVARSSISAVLAPLIRAGFVVETRVGANRVPRIKATSAGRGLLKMTAVPQVAHVEPSPLTDRLPASFRSLGGIKHPPIPGPGTKPDNMRAGDWQRWTKVIPSALHDACARGMW